jgi:heme-degrading monooxygenase HmoA
MYLIVWEFIIREECLGEFENVYGPGGEWARLFAKAEGYVETQLLRDTTNALRYVTLDFWNSREANEKFKQAQQKVYKELDERCQKLTVKETKLGEFDHG